MADLTREVAVSHAKAPHQTGASKKLRTLGGAGSGNFGHGGRPGEVGGSSEGGGGHAKPIQLENPESHKISRPVAIHHNSSDVFENGRPDFDAYFGGDDFAKDYPNEWGAHTYSLVLPAGSMVLDLNQQSDRDARVFVSEAAKIAWPDDKELQDTIMDGRAGYDEIYEPWTDKRIVLEAMKRFPGLDAVKYQDEYILTKKVIAKLPKMKALEAVERALGGAGSGNFGHSGRKGIQGGSGPGGVNSPSFKAWFGDSKVVDDDGEPLVVYHGTTHDVEQFAEAGSEPFNPEGDWGAAPYFTDSTDDLENYSGIGPDLNSRIEQRADEIDNEQDRNGSLAHARSVKEATEEIVGDRELSIPVYLSMQNPFVVGSEFGAKETTLNMEFEYEDDDPDKDIVGERGTLVDFMQAARDEMQNIDAPDERGLNSFFTELSDEGESVTASRLKAMWRNHVIDAMDDEGKLVRDEVLRRALARAGFDGVVDNTVGNRFTSMYGTRGTTHYIPFKPTQIKSAIGNKGTFDPKNPLITAAGTDTLVHAAADRHAPKLKVALRYAFAMGRRAVNRNARNVRDAFKDVPRAMAAALREVLPAALLATLQAGGQAGASLLTQQLGTSLRGAGGAGSGNWGHSGRPGQIGGSGSGVGLRHDRSDRLLATIHAADGGFSYHVITGSQPRTGYMVSAHKDREKVIDAKRVNLLALARYVSANRDLLQKPGNYLGAWHNPADGKVYLDVSTRVSTPEKAAALGESAQQLAYFDLVRGKSVEIPHGQTRAAQDEAVPQTRGLGGRRADVGRFDQADTRPDGPRSDRAGDQGSAGGSQGSVDLRALKKKKKTAPTPTITFAFDVADQDAVDWAHRHSAELITQVTKTTRRRIRNAIEELVTEGDWKLATDRIAALVGDDTRAEIIAHHETMLAASEGQRQSWNQAIDAGLLTGEEQRTWIFTPDGKACPTCEGLADETAPLGGFYVYDGEEYEGPPAHVGCRCTEGLV